MIRSPNLAARIAAQGALSMRRLWRQMPWYLAPDGAEARNIRSLYVETTWFGVLSGLAATYVPVFALRLGATAGQVGWLTALPALIAIFWTLPAARLIERQRRPMPIILVSGVLQRLVYVCMAVAPWLVAGGSGLVTVLIVLNTLVALPAAVISTAITALIPELSPAESRGTVVSTRWLLLATAEMLAALIGGQLLGLMPVPRNYQVVIGVGALVSLLSMRYLARMRVSDTALARRAPPGSRAVAQRSPLRQLVRSVLKQREFVRLTAAAFVFYWGIYLPGALWSILRVRDLGASDAWIGLIAMIVSVSTIAGYMVWGKVIGRRGNRRVLLVTALAVSIYAGLTALVPSIEWMIATSILGGVSWAGCNLALFNLLLRVCPADRRPTYIALHTALINVTAFAGPLLGAALADAIDIRPAFVVAAGLRLAGLVLFWSLL